MPVGLLPTELWTPPRQSHPGGVRSGCPTRETVQVDVGRKQLAAVDDSMHPVTVVHKLFGLPLK